MGYTGHTSSYSASRDRCSTSQPHFLSQLGQSLFHLLLPILHFDVRSLLHLLPFYLTESFRNCVILYRRWTSGAVLPWLTKRVFHRFALNIGYRHAIGIKGTVGMPRLFSIVRHSGKRFRGRTGMDTGRRRTFDYLSTFSSARIRGNILSASFRIGIVVGWSSGHRQCRTFRCCWGF